MNLNQLTYFVAAAETLNFTRAAEKCFISQTAMSLQIKALENKVGVPLFIRGSHRVELTAAGRVFYREALAILERSEEALKLAQTAAEGISGSITIGYVKGYEQSNFSETLPAFRNAFPLIEVRLLRDNMGALYQALQNGGCDIMFNLVPHVMEFPHLSHQYLKDFPVMAILWPGHPLASRRRLTYRDLKNEDFIIMQPKDRANTEAEEVIVCHKRGGFIPRIAAREKESEALLLMVSAGFGVAIMPEYCVRWFSHSKNLRIIPLYTEGGEAETMPFEMCWMPENDNPAIGQLCRFMRENKRTE